MDVCLDVYAFEPRHTSIALVLELRSRRAVAALAEGELMCRYIAVIARGSKYAPTSDYNRHV